MKIGFITDPLDSLKIKKDSTYAMMCEAARRDHELYAMQQDDLAWKRHRVVGVMSQITLRKPGGKGGGSWYALDPSTETPLADLDCVIMRKDPPFDVEYVTSTWLLEQAQRQGLARHVGVSNYTAAMMRTARDAPD